MRLSRAAVDKIGESLRSRRHDPAAQAELLLYCEQVRLATTTVRGIVINSTTSNVVSRDGKSFRSIIEKLLRQSVRLSQIQDIEGCRCVVDTIVEQDALYRRIDAQFETMKIDDKRKFPTNGYRAVHLIPMVGGERYEIQIRSRLQHSWAQAIETIADREGQANFKYGGGDADLQIGMQQISALIGNVERSERIAFQVAALQDYEDEPMADVQEYMGFEDMRGWLLANLDRRPFAFSDELELVWMQNPFDIRSVTATVIDLRNFVLTTLASLIGKHRDGETP